MTERRQPENRDLRDQWVTLTVYAERYNVDPRTVKKWADAGLVEIGRVSIKGHRPLLRVKNLPPWKERTR